MNAATGLFVLLMMLGGGRAAVAQDRGGELALTTTDVGVRILVDPSISSKRLVKSLELEAETIWAPYGIRLSWLDPRTVPSLQPSIDVHLDRKGGEPERIEWRTVLGNVMVGPDDRGPHPIHLSFNATWEMLKTRSAPLRLGISGVVPDLLMARALGRVLAHEIGHVLIGEKYHDRDGLMRAHFTTDQLAEFDRAPFRVTCSTMARLRAGLRGLTEGAAR